jgi:hypothetical protein
VHVAGRRDGQREDRRGLVRRWRLGRDQCRLRHGVMAHAPAFPRMRARFSSRLKIVN